MSNLGLNIYSDTDLDVYSNIELDVCENKINNLPELFA